jgi:hypothetical protein
MAKEQEIKYEIEHDQPAPDSPKASLRFSPATLLACIMCSKPFEPTPSNRVACPKCLRACKRKDGRP